MSAELLGEIRDGFARRQYIFTFHATLQAEERRITPGEVEEAILSDDADIIEDYSEDKRGPSCLILGTTRRGRTLHVQVCYPPLLRVITVYEPDDVKWLDPRTRR